MLEGLLVTLEATAWGIALAMTLGLVLAIARRVSPPLVRLPLVGVMEFIRSTPLLVQLFFLFYVMPEYDITISGFQAGVFGLGIHFAMYTAEVYRSGIEGIERGQWEASTALSVAPWKKWTFIILPQAIPRVIPALGNYVVAMLKEAPLLSAITVIDVVGEAERICSRDFNCLEPYTMAGVMFLAVSIPASILARTLEARFGTATA
jgi:polar amino acid transport system permease protein